MSSCSRWPGLPRVTSERTKPGPCRNIGPAQNIVGSAHRVLSAAHRARRSALHAAGAIVLLLLTFPVGATAAPRPLVVVVPGLNNNQRMMQSLADSLTGCGAAPQIVALTGHRPEDESWPDVDYQKEWRRDLEQAIEAARRTDPDAPLLGAGFSLGALLLTDRALSHPRELQGLLLFAPPLALTYRSVGIRLLLPLRWLIGELPSLSPERIRAHDSTSLRAYRGSIRLHDRVVDALLDRPGSLTVPARVYISDEDELIDAEEVRERIEEAKLPWTVRPVVPTKAVDDEVLQHLVPMADSYASEEWRAIEDDLCRAVSRFTRRTNTESAPPQEEPPAPQEE